jgi:hypothetical protein
VPSVDCNLKSILVRRFKRPLKPSHKGGPPQTVVRGGTYSLADLELAIAEQFTPAQLAALEALMPSASSGNSYYADSGGNIDGEYILGSEGIYGKIQRSTLPRQRSSQSTAAAGRQPTPVGASTCQRRGRTHQVPARPRRGRVWQQRQRHGGMSSPAGRPRAAEVARCGRPRSQPRSQPWGEPQGRVDGSVGLVQGRRTPRPARECGRAGVAQIVAAVSSAPCPLPFTVGIKTQGHRFSRVPVLYSLYARRVHCTVVQRAARLRSSRGAGPCLIPRSLPPRPKGLNDDAVGPYCITPPIASGLHSLTLGLQLEQASSQ